MRVARRGVFVVLTAAVSASVLGASVASCTHGNYDGSFDSAALEGQSAVGEGGAMGPPITKSVPRAADATTTIATSDGVFEVDVPAHAFPGDVTLTITQLADRSIDTGLVVPAYRVAVVPDGAATLPVQVVFRGNAASSGGSSNTLLPVTMSGTTTTTLPVTGTSNGGGGPSPNTIWGLTTAVTAIYSLEDVRGIGPGATTLLDQSTAPANCLSSCCGVNRSATGPSNQLYATETGCACSGATPNLECFATSCRDLATSARRCLDLKQQPSGTLSCVSGAATPGGCTASDNLCCYHSGPPSTSTCSPPSTPSGSCSYIERCTQDENCTGGAVCCAYDDEALCSTACPPERRVCGTGGPGSPGASCPASSICKAAGKCTLHVCGPIPSGCQ